MYQRIISLLRLGVALMLILAAPASANDGNDIVVVMGSSAGPLTKNQVADVYLGRSNALRPLDLPEANLSRVAFYREATERDTAQVKAVWSRIIFTGQGQPPKELPDAAAVKKAVASDPKMVGYIERSDLDPSVKVVLSLR